MDKYLPIGSVVLLKNGRKKIMIYGRKQMHVETGEEWDYLACLYPEGNINEEFMYLFNHDQIDKVYYLGYEDEEEKRFVEENLS
ncbi:MAG: DUF4176 domain-containing protein [Clostridium saudiense]|uniref:DUF4176 domain-containing protein n=1 Tax=Clostridium TaxID=1485 RepID=UPI0006C00EBF|nr:MULTISPECIES: DUF4176 domain-containing protein [Clostridium]MDU3520868.1 DUF4176 domain-containing protein [Clostridium saudiense]CUO71846.1 lipoprotein [Clostridium disporicum]